VLLDRLHAREDDDDDQRRGDCRHVEAVSDRQPDRRHRPEAGRRGEPLHHLAPQQDRTRFEKADSRASKGRYPLRTDGIDSPHINPGPTSVFGEPHPGLKQLPASRRQCRSSKKCTSLNCFTPNRNNRCLSLGMRGIQFIRDCRGVASIEFSLVAVPVFVLLAVTIEASLLVYAQHQLDVSVQRAARLLRTGSFQENANGLDPAQRLRSLLCGDGLRLYRCDEMRFDLVRTTTSGIKQTPSAYDANRGDWAAGFGTQFNCPSGGSIHLLRAAVPMLRPFEFLNFSGQRMPGGKQLLTSTAIFRAEDYADKSCV
jgi:hypothetical protein